MKKTILSIAIFTIFNVACTSAKRLPSITQNQNTEKANLDKETLVYNPQTNKYDKIILSKEHQNISILAKKDTIVPVPANQNTDSILFKSDQQLLPSNLRTSRKKNIYEVALLLPFNTNDPKNTSENISKNSNWAVHFYSGAKLALKKVENTGVHVNVTVVDCKNSDDEFKKLMQREDVAKSDLIIGPYSSNQSKLMIDFIKNKEITLVSPYTTSSNPTKDNPNYIQANPSINRHFECLSKHISENSDINKVYFITQNTESAKNRSKNFKNVFRNFIKSDKSANINEIIVPDNFLTSSEFKLDSLIIDNEPVSFVIPSWDEKYIKDILRKIESDRNGKQVFVYGMPQWQFIDEIKTYLNNLNVRISSNVLLNTGSSDVDKFRNLYFEEYAKMPDLEAFNGYDVTSYFIDQLLKKGNFFQKDCSPGKQLVTKFDIRPVVNNINTNVVDYYENFGLQILQFKWPGFQIIE